MAAYAFFMPIVLGQEEVDRRFLAEATGARRAEFEASRKRLGIRAERGWHQSTPQGTFAVVYLEADDLSQAFAGIATSTDSFDVWFREQLLAVHGIDMSQPMPGPMNEMVMDWGQ